MYHHNNRQITVKVNECTTAGHVLTKMIYQQKYIDKSLVIDNKIWSLS